MYRQKFVEKFDCKIRIVPREGAAGPDEIRPWVSRLERTVLRRKEPGEPVQRGRRSFGGIEIKSANREQAELEPRLGTAGIQRQRLVQRRNAFGRVGTFDQQATLQETCRGIQSINGGSRVTEIIQHGLKIFGTPSASLESDPHRIDACKTSRQARRRLRV